MLGPREERFGLNIRVKWRAALREFFGAAIYAFVCCGSFAVLKKVASLANGLALGACIHLTNGFVNPVFTWAALWARKINLLTGICIFLFQLFGSVLGAVVVLACIPLPGRMALGETVLAPGIGVAQGITTESILTFISTFVFFASGNGNLGRDEYPQSSQMPTVGPLIVAFVQVGLVITGLSTTGASTNPARSLAPLVAASLSREPTEWGTHYVYWIGPLIGGSAAVVFTELFFNARGSARPYIPLPSE